jgi:hypothetical protein
VKERITGLEFIQKENMEAIAVMETQISPSLGLFIVSVEIPHKL